MTNQHTPTGDGAPAAGGGETAGGEDHAAAVRAAPPARPPGEAEPAIDFEVIELLFFAYRDFTADPDAMLASSGFGRAHHRVVHFVNRNPGMTVADLLDTLKITKQSLARVLRQLVESGHIRQETGPRDRRQRRLYPTAAGRALALALAAPQSQRIAGALAAAVRAGGPEARAAVTAFLRGMIGARPEDEAGGSGQP